ncbi:MAG: hypothetical protein A3D31_08955 [Candidatus Fluviicola riflensis]|nr:MAG: hypothetical protein CHH17_13365 [Candidatus Fluviicola riflensis]OGS77139.1 MAG: hypothetical protein A3D31_08955 [Candidatus Fluviicola riflensis]OGS82074.1 MAG: hypothetical protein A2724_17900 [Fluviicola sp. RIFCSPHIGHO2_01_FULL_43_53]OGS87768.1 MAG: hypothetical protein A3E30_15335 [Fluviicola sp. RIFCSPHIGHO2_12_FULL_43_24]
MAILKKIKNNELYLYMNGNLIYKRWLDTGQSTVFDVMAYDKYTSMSLRDLDSENQNELLIVKATIKLLTTEAGGRKSGFISGYRPNHVFEYNTERELLMAYIGDIHFEGKSSIEPGEEREVIVRFLLSQPIEKHLSKGCLWWIHEGSRVVGQCELIDFLD